MTRFGDLMEQYLLTLRTAATPKDVDLASWYAHYFAESDLLAQLNVAHISLEAAIKKAVSERAENVVEVMDRYSVTSEAAWEQYIQREEQRKEAIHERLAELGVREVAA